MMNANQDHRVNDFGRCLNCGAVHPQCQTIGCSNPTHCPPDEPGEPFTYCDAALAPEEWRHQPTRAPGEEQVSA